MIKAMVVENYDVVCGIIIKLLSDLLDIEVIAEVGNSEIIATKKYTGECAIDKTQSPMN